MNVVHRRWVRDSRGSRVARLRAATVVSLLLTGLVAATPVQAVAESSVSEASGTAAAAGDPVGRELRAALEDVVAAGATGVTLRVDDGRRTYRLADGQAQLEPSRQLRPGDELRVGSITKPFVATVVLQLVGERRLTLDDTVEKWLPGQVPNGGEITVRQLLNHTSGLFNYTNDQDFLIRLFTEPSRPIPREEILALVNSRPPSFAPGAGWEYSNSNYVLLGLLMEQVTGRSAAELVDRRIIRPLGLRNTYLAESEQVTGRHAHGYFPPSLTGEEVYYDVTELHQSWIWTAGALVSNVDDQRRFWKALLGGRLLRPAQLTQMKTLVPLGETGYGLGLYRFETPCGPLWGHDGKVPGYTTIAWYDESGRRGFTLGLPTEPDPPLASALVVLRDTASCRALGKPVPTAEAEGAGERETRARVTAGSQSPVPGLVDPGVRVPDLSALVPSGADRSR